MSMPNQFGGDDEWSHLKDRRESMFPTVTPAPPLRATSSLSRSGLRISECPILGGSVVGGTISGGLAGFGTTKRTYSVSWSTQIDGAQLVVRVQAVQEGANEHIDYREQHR